MDHTVNGSVLWTMIDHILMDFIGAMRGALEDALLQRQAVEERFQVDVFLGDVSWETSYSLPGEEQPPRVRADVSVDWPTWSQSAFRSWSIGEPPEDFPEIVLEITLRQQRLARAPDLAQVIACLPEESPEAGGEVLVRTAPLLEQVTEADGTTRYAMETTYQGTFRLGYALLEDPSGLGEPVASLARFVASALVRLGDLDVTYLPPEPPRDASP